MLLGWPTGNMKKNGYYSMQVWTCGCHENRSYVNLWL